MAYSVPPLPYAFDALEPHIDAQTMEIHHDKHHQAYVTTPTRRSRAPSGPTSRSRSPAEPRLAARRQAGPPSATTAAATTTTRCSGSRCRPAAGGEPVGALGDAIDSTFGSFADFQAQVQGRRHQPLRLRLGLADPRRLRARDRLDRQPGQPDQRRQDAAARRRRLGARLLPEVPEPPPRLPRRVVEHRQLGRRRRAVLEGLRVRTRVRDRRLEARAAGTDACSSSRVAGRAVPPGGGAALRSRVKRRPVTGETRLVERDGLGACHSARRLLVRRPAASSAARRSGVIAVSSSFSASHARASAAWRSSRTTALPAA